MQLLLQFLYRYRSFLLFLFLEGVCFWLIVENNNYQGAKFFNTTNTLAASLSESSSAVVNFFDLANQNRVLTEENAQLKKLLASSTNATDSATSFLAKDSSLWEFIPAKVINNSVFLQNNYLTVNKGSDDGITKGMGVIGSNGVAGRVVDVTKHYASVTSLLHSSSLVSSVHRVSGALCTTTWNGKDPLIANVEFLPRHLKIQVGDTIVTSGYNAIYPPESLVGTVHHVSIAEDATFYEVEIKLATDFYQLGYVSMVAFHHLAEKDSLEENNRMDDE